MNSTGRPLAMQPGRVSNSESMTFAGERFPELDGLRGLAAVGVAVFHYLIPPAQKLPRLMRTIDLIGMSPLSVDMFFILSGFLIGGILMRLKESPDYYKAFYAGVRPESCLCTIFGCSFIAFFSSQPGPPCQMA